MASELVTGGAGFIGGSFARHRLADPHVRLVVLDNLTHAASPDGLPPPSDRFALVVGDIRNGDLVRDLLARHAIDRVVHFAAETHVDRSIDDPVGCAETNVLGTVRLLESVRAYWSGLPAVERDAFRFVHVSTDEVYGQLGSEGHFDERSAYAPRSPYAASKAAADHFVRAYHATFGLPTIVTHSSNNFGPYQFPEKLIPLMILNAIEGRPLPVYGDGRHVRDWLYVDDHSRGIELALLHGRPGESYLFAAGVERTNLQVVESICDLVDRLNPGLAHRPCRNLIEFVEDRPGHDFRYALDSGKAERELGWKTSRGWDVGLEETVRWYMDHGEWVLAANRRHDRRRLGRTD